MQLPQTALTAFICFHISTALPWVGTDTWLKGNCMGFIGTIRGGLCWVQEKSVPIPIRENSNKSSAGFDHCTLCYQLSLLDLALHDSREEPAADKWVLLLGLVEIWEVSKLCCQAWNTWLLGMEVRVRYRAKWRIELVNPNCKVLCHGHDMSTKTLWPSTSEEHVNKKYFGFVCQLVLCQRGEIFISTSMAPDLSQTHHAWSIEFL